MLRWLYMTIIDPMYSGISGILNRTKAPKLDVVTPIIKAK
ncbi:MAG: hypothetical protein ACI87V_001450, partial [Flavobacteriales bacterium]